MTQTIIHWYTAENWKQYFGGQYAVSDNHKLYLRNSIKAGGTTEYLRSKKIYHLQMMALSPIPSSSLTVQKE